MSSPQAPRKIILGSRTTQEFVVDKESLARWAQELVESNTIAHGIEKHEIEKGFCRYQLRYEQLAMLSEHFIQQSIDSGRMQGFSNLHLVGKGKDTGVSVTADLAAPSPTPGIHMLNGLEDVKPLAPQEALEQVKKALSFGADGLTLDGKALLGSLQSLVQFLEQEQAKGQKMIQSMPAEDRARIVESIVTNLAPHMRNMGVEVRYAGGSKMEVTMRYDALLGLAENHGGTDKGFTVKREPDGTASVLIDYRRMVDRAVDKAQAILASKSPDGHSHITHIDGDTFKLTMSKGGDGELGNKLFDTILAKVVALNELHQGGIRQAYGTLKNPNQLPDFPKF